MKRKQQILQLMTFCAGSVLMGQANWQLIDNFDDNDLDPWIITSANNIIGMEPGQEEGDEAYLELIYPEGYEDNAALNLESGGYGYENQYGSVFSFAPLPVEVPDGTTSTLYFQYYQQGGSNQFHFGVSALEPIPLTADKITEPVRELYEQPNTWNHHALLFRVNEDNVIDLRDGSSYRKTNFVLESYTWYELWLVCHNREGAYGDAEGDTWELWIKGGEWDVPTQVPVPPATPFDNLGNPNPTLDFAIFRVPTDEPLRTVMFSSQTGAPTDPNDGDPHLIDDLFYTEGEYVDTPAGAVVREAVETWAGYLVLNVDGTKYVDTGDFLGYVALSADYPESSWVYSYGLGSWVWAVESTISANPNGSWVYVLK